MKSELRNGEPLTLVTVCLDGQALGHLRESIASLPTLQLRAEFQHYLAENDDQILLEQPDIYIIDFDRDREKAVRTAERIREVLGRAAIFALSSSPTSDLIIRAMRCGCSEYLFNPLDRGELLRSLARARERRSEKRQPIRGRVLSLVGAKGGSGVTTLATHLGASLAKLQKRKTILIDYHPQLGDASFYLSLPKHTYHFFSLAENTHRLDPELLEGFLVRHPSGLDVLQAPDGLDPTNNGVSADAIGHTLEFLRSRYQFIVVDCPPGLDKQNMAVIVHSDELYLVTTPEAPALRHLVHHLDQLRSFDYAPERVQVVLNRQSKKAAVSDEQVEKASGKRIHWKVPNQYPEVARTFNTGSPAPASSEFMRNLNRWAEGLAQKQSEGATSREGGGRTVTVGVATRH
jgi:pilus assembly protein CpaE